MKIKIILLALSGFILGVAKVSAQQTTGAQPYSLQQAIQFALENQPRLNEAAIRQQIAKAQVGQIRSIGLPQINASAELNNNFKLQKSLVDVSRFGPPTNPPAEPQYSAFAFGLQYAGSAAITASQLLFDGSYLIGLKAAKVYTDLATKQAQQTENEVIEQVTKAYYGVLVNHERQALLNQNLVRLENLLRETTQIYKEGFAEKIDVDRLQVSYNNLKVEKDKTERLVNLSADLLKFQMGMEVAQAIVLTDRLADAVVDAQAAAADNFNYNQRIEYSILETQRDLARLDVKNKQAGYYPKLLLNARYGLNGSSSTLSDLLELRTAEQPSGYRGNNYQNWFDFGLVGVSLQIPIFDGLRKKYEISQAKLAVASAENGFKILKQNIDLQLQQSNATLQSALQVVAAQKQSLELAQEIARVANIKFKEGVGSNLEVISAETELRQAQTNYYSALYDALIAKIELQKATGTLTK